MSKFKAKSAYQWRDAEGNTVVSFVVDNDESYPARLTVEELKTFDVISVEAKQHSESRTYKQNRMFWAIVKKLSDAMNGSHRKEDMDRVYANILIKAHVEYIDIPVVEEAIWILEKQFKNAVIKLGYSFEGKKGKILEWHRCFVGSSIYNTKQMGELIDYALDMASSLGIVDSEIESIREEYRL